MPNPARYPGARVVRKAVGDPDGLTVSVRAALGSYDGRRRAEKFQLILDSIRSFEFGRFGELLLAVPRNGGLNS